MALSPGHRGSLPVGTVALSLWAPWLSALGTAALSPWAPQLSALGTVALSLWAPWAPKHHHLPPWGAAAFLSLAVTSEVEGFSFNTEQSCTLTLTQLHPNCTEVKETSALKGA